MRAMRFITRKCTERVTLQCRWLQHKDLRPFDWVVLGIERRNVMKQVSNDWYNYSMTRHYVYRIAFFGFYVNVWRRATKTQKTV